MEECTADLESMGGTTGPGKTVICFGPSISQLITVRGKQAVHTLDHPKSAFHPYTFCCLRQVMLNSLTQ